MLWRLCTSIFAFIELCKAYEAREATDSSALIIVFRQEKHLLLFARSCCTLCVQLLLDTLVLFALASTPLLLLLFRAVLHGTITAQFCIESFDYCYALLSALLVLSLLLLEDLTQRNRETPKRWLGDTAKHVVVYHALKLN